MDEILVNYFQGEISPEDQHKLKKWLGEDEAHPVILEQMEKYWRQGELRFPEQKDRVFNRIKTTAAELPAAQEKEVRVLNFRAILKYAAAIVIASLLSIYLYNSFGPSTDTRTVNYIEKSTEPGQRITTRLADGTAVKLNSDSRIVSPETFSGNTREVTLEGEAFFEVIPDPDKPFIVHFGDNQVRVVGTSFNVRAYEDAVENTVAVKTGKVSVKEGQEEVNLTPHEVVVLNGSPLSVIKIEDPGMYFGWVDNQLAFDKVTLEEAMEAISKWYGMEYEIQAREIADSPYTAKHKDPTLRVVMESLSFAYGLKYEINENKIIIK